MKDKNIIALVGIITYIVITSIIIILFLNVIRDLKATVNGYKSDRNICRMEKEEIIDNFKKLEEKCEK